MSHIYVSIPDDHDELLVVRKIIIVCARTSVIIQTTVSLGTGFSVEVVDHIDNHFGTFEQ